jgi:hypothetical protein
MRKLNKPIVNNPAVDNPGDDAEQVYRTCISSKIKDDLKALLESVAPEINNAATAFDAAATVAVLHMLPTQVNVGGVPKADLEKVYTQRMVPADSLGRQVYERLLHSSPHNKCPLCGLGYVTTLDHHLPKTDYPALAVTPVNLIPACSYCNKEKLQDIPTCAEEQTLHPYYDNFEDELWLFAEVMQTNPAALRYYVAPPVDWDSIKAARAKHHLTVFKLADLFGSNAGSELVNIRHGLSGIFEREGAAGVRTYLQRQAETYAAAYLNSWQTAMYQALAASDWFCEGGFR